LGDFVCGCAAAACVRAHAKSGGCSCLRRPSRKSLQKSDANLDAVWDVVDGGAALLEEGKSGDRDMPVVAVRRRNALNGGDVHTDGELSGSPSREHTNPADVARAVRLRGIVADLLALGLVVFVFCAPAFKNDGPVAVFYGMPSNYTRDWAGGDTSVGMGCHIWSAPIAVWLYCICASNEGAGLVAKALGHPALISLGSYALHMYLFTIPNKFVFQWAFNHYIWGEGWTKLYEPTENMTYDDTYKHADRLQASEAWTFEFITLMFVSMLYAHLVEEPLVQRFRRYYDRRTSAPRKKQHRK
jgi:hypothetical protein